MSIEEYKKFIIQLVEASDDADYIIAVYTFADSYPDKSKVKTPQNVSLSF